MPDNRAIQQAEKLIEELESFDKLTVLILNGHLLLERMMTETLETFVLHGDELDAVRLSFSQKLQLSKTVTTSEQDNNMWTLISKMNNVRNKVVHGADVATRSKAFQSLKSIYAQEFSNPILPDPKSQSDEMIWLCAVAGARGFLSNFHDEVVRLKSHIIALDKQLNKGSLTVR